MNGVVGGTGLPVAGPRGGAGVGDGVVVAGGGIAGIAAALRLAEAGVPVTLIETRHKLGGRATSFDDVRTGERLDNCQHVTLGCCTNYLDLLARLGAADKVAWHDTQYWVEAGGRVSRIAPGVLPAPLHYAEALLRAKFLEPDEVRAIGSASALIATARCEDWAGRSFAAFLDEAGQPERARRRFWEPIVVSACNLPVERVSAPVALFVFRHGFIASAGAARIGIPTVPLIELYDRAEGAIASAGGRILLGTSVEAISGRRVETTAGVFEGRAVICALPPERAARVIDPRLARLDPRLAALERFMHSPILGVHLRFDRPVLPLPHAVLVDRAVQWLFRKDEQGRAVHAVISAADAWTALDEGEIVRRVVEDISACFPGSAGASLVAARAVKEKRATFAATPESDFFRPRTTGPSGLILAGDYTSTGWPATMEGATISGYRAAAAVLGLPEGVLRSPPMRSAGLGRLLRLDEAPIFGRN